MSKPLFKPLKLVHPVSLQREVSVQVCFSLDAGLLSAWFEVRGQEPSFNPSLLCEEPQWGLWDWDVVEVFLKASASETYYEFQVSPLNQFFELQIFEPRRRFNKAFRSGFRHRARIESKDCWKAEMHLPLERLGWDGKLGSLSGNAFAVLGKKDARGYWGLNLPHQEKPDFHLPQHFLPFF